MTIRDKILDFLVNKAPDRFDDDELARELSTSRQYVRAECSRLEREGRIKRGKGGPRNKFLNWVDTSPRPEPPKPPIRDPRFFEDFAKKVMAQQIGVSSLEKRRNPGWPKEFDLASPDGKVVGDAKYYTLVDGERTPSAKLSIIAEHVWLLEKISADFKFLVFGHDARVPKQWLKRYGYLVNGVKFYFLSDDGSLEELN